MFPYEQCIEHLLLSYMYMYVLKAGTCMREQCIIYNLHVHVNTAVPCVQGKVGKPTGNVQMTCACVSPCIAMYSIDGELADMIEKEAFFYYSWHLKSGILFVAIIIDVYLASNQYLEAKVVKL